MTGPDGWSEQAANVLDPDGNMLVLDDRCRTCILGGPESIAHTLRAGRVREMVDQSRAAGFIPCHSTLSNTTPGAAVCRGWFEAVGADNSLVRFMGRLGAVRFVPLDQHLRERR